MSQTLRVLYSVLGQILFIVSLSEFVAHFWLTVIVIDHALKSNGIPSIRIEKGGKGSAAKLFRDNSTLRVMLLHGERENAGLNIVCASRVFLLESVVNHAFEVQGMWMTLACFFATEEPFQQLPVSTACPKQGQHKVGFPGLLFCFSVVYPLTSII